MTSATTPAPGSAANLMASGIKVPLGAAMRPCANTSSMPAPSLSGGDLALQCGELVEIGLDDGPDLDPHMVGVEVVAVAQRGPRSSDRLQAVLHGTLGVREAQDLAGLVAHHGQLPNLRHRHQAPVGGVGAGDAVEEQDVLGASTRVTSNSRSRHRLSLRPTIGCTPRTRESSTKSPSDQRKVK